MITGHGGALKTGRNTYKYFSTIAKYKVDAIEVDVMKRGDTLFLGHILPPLFLKNAIKLDYVFNFCKEHNVKVNCDLKFSHIVKPVIELAKKMGATDYLIFTGNVMPSDVKDIDAGEVYVNNAFYTKKYPLTIDNLENIKKYLDSFGNKHIVGINIPYRYAGNEFILKAKEIGLPLSIYTCDEKALLERLIPFEVANITTNLVDIALGLRDAAKLDKEKS